ncbi:MAG: heparan-alpha-glucosaminide N-acetyltransferase [Candidatus Thermoplasmatota archaeon]
MKDKQKNRFWEIDTLRGIAVIMMITYHVFYDLNFYQAYSINIHGLFWRFFLYPIGGIFLLLVGISLYLSFTRKEKRLSHKEILYIFWKRGVKIFLLGMVITAITLLYLGEGFVVFGVLHCIGLSIILGSFFLKKPLYALPAGLLCIAGGLILQNFTFSFPWLLWIGFIPSDFYTVDYFPLLPWFGVVLTGIFIGKNLYPNYQRRHKIPDMSHFKIIKTLCFIGRHSLMIYFLHQPVIIALIHLMFKL